MSTTQTINNVKDTIDAIVTPAVYGRQGATDPNSCAIGQWHMTLQITRQQITRPDPSNEIEGIPSAFLTTVGNLRGFIKARAVNPSNLSCDYREKEEVIQLLKEGVYY